MRKALIVWGGWCGHDPDLCASIIRGWLKEDGFDVSVETSTSVFADPAIRDLSLIVPIYTMSKIEKPEVENLCAAVRSGVGLAGHHGGMCDAFRDAVEYQFMCGGQWVAHPGNIIDYRVNVTKPDDPVMEGVSGFRVPLRTVLHACRSGERGARHHDFHGRARALDERRGDARCVEEALRRGPRLLFLARPSRL